MEGLVVTCSKGPEPGLIQGSWSLSWTSKPAECPRNSNSLTVIHTNLSLAESEEEH